MGEENNNNERSRAMVLDNERDKVYDCIERTYWYRVFLDTSGLRRRIF